MTAPNVLGTPKPESSVMMSRMLGACLGGTTRGAHQALDLRASSLMTPPNLGSRGGSCLPSMVVVAPGEPSVPVTSTAVAQAAAAIAVTAIKRRTLLLILILVRSFRCSWLWGC